MIPKPAGLLSQGEHRGDPNVVNWARAHVGRNYVGLIHRLDRNTSGIMILAKRSKAAHRLTEQLQDGTLERKYLAWLEGSLPQSVTWKHVLLKDSKTNRVKVLRPGQKTTGLEKPKEAILSVRPLKSGTWKNQLLTLAEFTLQTGRSHQIRVQAAEEGFPLLGDAKYGSGRKLEFGRPALHSAELKFKHPISGEEMMFQAPLPKDMQLQIR